MTLVIESALALGDYRLGLATTRRLLQLEPWSEKTHRLQMLLLAQSGQRAAALDQFEACRQILAEEFDLAPDVETVTLYERIRAGHVSRQSTVAYATHVRARDQPLARPIYPNHCPTTRARVARPQHAGCAVKN